MTATQTEKDVSFIVQGQRGLPMESIEAFLVSQGVDVVVKLRTLRQFTCRTDQGTYERAGQTTLEYNPGKGGLYGYTPEGYRETAPAEVIADWQPYVKILHLNCMRKR